MTADPRDARIQELEAARLAYAQLLWKMQDWFDKRGMYDQAHKILDLTYKHGPARPT